MKKIIILTIICGTIITFLIYKRFYHETTKIIVLGDAISLGTTAYEIDGYSYNDYLKDYYEEKSIVKEYIKEFAEKDETSESLKMKLNNNYVLESTNISIQQAIAKANIVTISLGMEELNNKKNIKSKDIEKYINNIEKIIRMLRVYNDKKIVMTSLYQTDKISKEKITILNMELKRICEENKILYIDIENITEKKEFFFDQTSYYLNYKGHRFISEKIIDILKD